VIPRAAFSDRCVVRISEEPAWEQTTATGRRCQDYPFDFGPVFPSLMGRLPSTVQPLDKTKIRRVVFEENDTHGPQPRRRWAVISAAKDSDELRWVSMLGPSNIPVSPMYFGRICSSCSRALCLTHDIALKAQFWWMVASLNSITRPYSVRRSRHHITSQHPWDGNLCPLSARSWRSCRRNN